MPFFIVRIEQTAHTRFQVEAEVSFPVCRLLNKTFPSFDEAMGAVREFHDRHLGQKTVPAADFIVAAVELISMAAPTPEVKPQSMVAHPDIAGDVFREAAAQSARDILIDIAIGRGIDVDRRWSEATLRTKIAEHDLAQAQVDEAAPVNVD